jgi:hypothetical protein
VSAGPPTAWPPSGARGGGAGVTGRFCSAPGFPSPPLLRYRNLKKFRRWQCEQVRTLRGEAKSSWKRLMGVESACDVACRFRLSTHKMVFIVNSEDYMYRRGTLGRAKQVRPNPPRPAPSPAPRLLCPPQAPPPTPRPSL